MLLRHNDAIPVAASATSHKERCARIDFGRKRSAAAPVPPTAARKPKPGPKVAHGHNHRATEDIPPRTYSSTISGVPEQRNVRTWACHRDETDPDAPYSATLTIGKDTIALGRGISEVDAYATLIDVLARKGLADDRVLGMQELMRRR
jgi:hypothetical protein